MQRYKVEPYVVAADVYSEAPHAGRGGWTWYTGSAGWLYRAGLEWILGFRLHENRRDAHALRAGGMARLHASTTVIAARRTRFIVDRQPDPSAVPQFTIDGEAQPAGRATVDLNDDGAPHTVHVTWVTTAAAADFAATRSS